MKTLFASVLGSAVKNFEGKEYYRVTAMSGSTVVKFKSETQPELASLALVDNYVIGDEIPWSETVPKEIVKEGRAFSVLQMYTTMDAINSAKEVAKTLEGLTL